jgi:hypothetical protein
MERLHQAINDNLQHHECEVQRAAGNSLATFLDSFGGPAQLQAVQTYCEGLFDALPEVRLGSSIALASLPCAMATPVRETLTGQLCKAADFNQATDVRDADARVAAIDVRPFCRCQKGCLQTNNPLYSRAATHLTVSLHALPDIINQPLYTSLEPAG